MEHTHTEIDEATGVTLKIVPDTDCAHCDPYAYYVAVIFAVLHRRYTNPAQEISARVAFDSEGNSFDFTTTEGIEHFSNEMNGDDKPWIVFPLFMYDHGNTIYKASERANPFTDRWDSGRVGIIALKRNEVGKPGEVITRNGQEAFTIGSYLEQANAVCENYTDWANGNVYGYVIEDADGETLDSCWGYIGDWGGYVLEEAKSAMAHHVKKALAEQVRELEEARPDMGITEHGPTLLSTTQALADALKLIAYARDFNAEYGRYPYAEEASETPGNDPDGPCFDDWAADVAQKALDFARIPLLKVGT